jgi:hypothetical protein
MNKDLIVEIFVPIEGSDGYEGCIATGYPIARDRILTARHPLYPDDGPARDPSHPIEVRWRCPDADGDWQPVRAIAWENARWDLALLDCPLPPRVAANPGFPCESPPDDGMRWTSVGFPRVAGRRNDRREPFNMQGHVYSALTGAERFAVSEEAGPSREDAWKGASGAPVFVDWRILGVIVSVPADLSAKRLDAVPLWRVLREEPAFREQIGFDERKRRYDQAWRDRLAHAGAAPDDQADKALLNQVFISYRWEGDRHSAAVRDLADKLTRYGFRVVLDSLYYEEHGTSPGEGWPAWCEAQTQSSACVLCVLSPGWRDAWEGRSSGGTALGCTAETRLIRHLLYDSGGRNERVRFVVTPTFGDERPPVYFRGDQCYRAMESEEDWTHLARWLSGQLDRDASSQLHSKTSILWPSPTQFDHRLADRVQEWPAIVALLAGRTDRRILIFDGGTKLGKSVLLRKAGQYAKRSRIPVGDVDFRACQDIESVLARLCTALGDNLPRFYRDGGTNADLLQRDLRTLEQPVLLTFDTHDASIAGSKVAQWLDLQILGEVDSAPGCAVIVAGQQCPRPAGRSWEDQAEFFGLVSIDEVHHWGSFLESDPRFSGVKLAPNELALLIDGAGGVPGLLLDILASVAKRRGH